MEAWKHPTGESPKRICILGLGPTSQDWHTAHTQYTPPLAAVDEVWTVNKGFRTTRADVVFIMDDLVEEARKSKRYGEEIADCQIPVITSTVDPLVTERWPNALQYPLTDIVAHYGAQLLSRQTGFDTIDGEDALKTGLEQCAYFNNSIPYMLAYAGFIGVENIALFGCDYTFPGSSGREDDRANAEYWIAALQFLKGISFQFPHRTTIMNRDRWGRFYGFNGRQPF